MSTVTYRVVGRDEAATVSLGLSQQVDVESPQQFGGVESSTLVEFVGESLFTQHVSAGSVGMLTLQHDRGEFATDFEVRQEFVLAASVLGLVLCFLQHEGVSLGADFDALLPSKSPSTTSRSSVASPS